MPFYPNHDTHWLWNQLILFDLTFQRFVQNWYITQNLIKMFKSAVPRENFYHDKILRDWPDNSKCNKTAQFCVSRMFPRILKYSLSKCQQFLAFAWTYSPLCQWLSAFSKPPSLMGCWSNLWTVPNKPNIYTTKL